MLRTDAVTQDLWKVLRTLSAQEPMRGFALGGGTSLSLRYGHRRSADLDFFSSESFNTEEFLQAIHLCFTDLAVLNRTSGSLCLSINGVKVDVLQHSYRVLEPPELIDGIRLVTCLELSAMKVNAVTNRGSKKDFSDLLLLHHEGHLLRDAVDAYCQKYGEAGRFMALRSLQWFGDAEQEPSPWYLNGWDWEHVRDEFARLAAGLLAKPSDK